MRGDAAEQRALEVYGEWARPVLEAISKAIDEHEDAPAPAILAALETARPNTAALATALAEATLSGLQVPAGEDQGEELAAAASDPAERVRIAKLAAEARWRGHEKKKPQSPIWKQKIQAAFSPSTGMYPVDTAGRRSVRRYGISLKKGERYKLFLSHDRVRHIMKEHGDPVYERQRGQIEVAHSDFFLFPRIARSPDSVVLDAETGANGEPRYVVDKKINGINYRIILEVKKGRKGLWLITMYKH